MLFLSPKITEYLKETLNFPELMWREMEEGYFHALTAYLETEVNLYLEENNLAEEQKLLKQAAESDQAVTEIMDAFIALYNKYPAIENRVNEHMQKFTHTMLAVVLQHLGETKKTEFEKLLDQEIESYSAAREQLERKKEI